MQGTVSPQRKKPRLPGGFPWWFAILLILAGGIAAMILWLASPAVLANLRPEPTRVPLVVVPTQSNPETMTPGPAETATHEPAQPITSPAVTATGETVLGTLSPTPAFPTSVTSVAPETALPWPTPTQVILPTVAVAFPTPTLAPEPGTWRAEFFANAALYGSAALTRNDLDINYDWQHMDPAPGIPADNFSVRWVRIFEFSEGIHRFHALVDDGVRIFVDNALVLDEWRSGSLREVAVDGQLPAGPHQVRVEYYDQVGEARIHVWWEKVGPQTFPDWKGEYWANRHFEGVPKLIRNDVRIDFDWGRGAPDTRLPADDFSVRWSRSMRFDEGLYRFHAVADDGIRLYVDGNLLMDEWQDGRSREFMRAMNLSTGNHSLRVDYYEHGADSVVRVWWERIGPATYPDWKGEYWNNRELKGSPVLTRNDERIEFNWKQGSPASELPADNFSARWTRQVDLQAGIHRFHVQADDGVRVYVDGRLAIDQWSDGNGSQTYIKDEALAAGRHLIVVEYYEHKGRANINFWRDRVGDLPTPTATATSVPSATPTATTSPTPTDAPTSTPTQSPTPSPTPTPTPTASPEPTATQPPVETPAPVTPIPGPEPQIAVRFNEVLPVPQSVDWNEDGQVTPADAWLELRNTSHEKVDLTGWRLEITSDEQVRYSLPDDATLKPNGYLVLFPLHRESGLAEGGVIRLFNSLGQLVDEVSLPQLPGDASLSLDEAGKWHADWPPTPGKRNTPFEPNGQGSPGKEPSRPKARE